MPAGPILSVEELSYPPVLREVSFALDAGELVAIMGPSGCGKTTLLKCVNRLLEPAAGRVALEGDDGLPPVALRRRVGMVSQVPFMFDGSVRDNLRRAVEYSGSALDAPALDALLERVAFDGDPEQEARTLSVGQQQRVSAARSLACRPAVLLCDEPTAALDHDNALRLEATFRELCADGLAVVWVTHDRAQAERLADRTLRLSDGVLG